MKYAFLIAAMALLPTQLIAHDAGGVIHLHPHGGEALLALAAIVAALVIWRLGRS